MQHVSRSMENMLAQEQVELAVISTDGDIDAALKVLRTLSSYCNFSQESSQVIELI